MGARKRGRRCIPPRASPPALSPCANHGSLSQTYIIPGLPSFPPPLPCRPSRAPAPSQCSWNPYSPKAHPRSSLAMRSRSFSSVRACSCDHECVGYGLIGASVVLHTAGIYTIFFTFALIILTVYKRPLPIDWNMVVATAVLYVACMAVSVTICALYATVSLRSALCSRYDRPTYHFHCTSHAVRPAVSYVPHATKHPLTTYSVPLGSER